MIRTIIYYTFFWLYMLVSIALFIPFLFMKLFKMNKPLDGYIYYLTTTWARNLIRIAGGKITVKGLENIPKSNNVCFIANHQGGFDIPLILGYMPKTIGFIAKKELMYIPILGIWMKAIKCIFINRANKRESVRVIQQGVDQIKAGYPMVIFPEGTRSQNSKMSPFKGGSLKLPLRSNAKIIPITIDGSYKMKELRGGLITSASVTLFIHPTIYVRTLSDDEKKELKDSLWKIINSKLS